MSLKRETINLINRFAGSNTPFLFIADFDCNKTHLHPIKSLPKEISFSFPRSSHPTHNTIVNNEICKLKETSFISELNYKKMFDQVSYHLHRGDTYLLNLTTATKIDTTHTISDIYKNSKAPYKVLAEGSFTLFSPETFIKIENNIISTYPMKGTIDASIHNAKELILNSPKESAEHATIVDLLRNDLSRVSNNVQVPTYRYVDKIKTAQRELLQVSSQITGELDEGWRNRLGDIINELLPAGSVTGAPKKRSVEIIKSVEQDDRGFYTGISLYFDGESVDSCVNIRFIEQKEDGTLLYRSGGGVTSQSICEDEYNEMKDKVYVPIY